MKAEWTTPCGQEIAKRVSSSEESIVAAFQAFSSFDVQANGCRSPGAAAGGRHKRCRGSMITARLCLLLRAELNRMRLRNQGATATAAADACGERPLSGIGTSGEMEGANTSDRPQSGSWRGVRAGEVVLHMSSGTEAAPTSAEATTVEDEEEEGSTGSGVAMVFASAAARRLLVEAATHITDVQRQKRVERESVT
ncbi:hypothetical protein VaNZ11_014755 [Volvox africanus]|uniref:Uncharacterized protein n=1 Tax=Volvox africanus TaxID=51714 RepID=A0ABQ5SK68_9CHLO|nr:hypothetical protein VaNZ11_014755 [Volvox africanus]